MIDCSNTNLTQLIGEIRDKHSELLKESKVDFAEMVTFPECTLQAIDITLNRIEEQKKNINEYIEKLEKEKAKKSVEILYSDIIISYNSSIRLIILEEVIEILKEILKGE